MQTQHLMAANLLCLTGSKFKYLALNSFVLPIHKMGVSNAPVPSLCSNGENSDWLRLSCLFD